MTVPTSVIQILETNNVAYELKSPQQADSAPHLAAVKTRLCLVKSVLLKDSQGTLQLLFPEGHMIDLSAIKSKFGRTLEPLPQEELYALLEAQELKTVPAIPEWQGLPSIVDASLLQHQKLLLDTGDNQEQLEINISDFQNIVKPTNIGEIAVLPPKLLSVDEMDQAHILHSLSNFTTLRVKKRLEETLELPPLPTTAQRIIKLRADPEADISDLSAIVELDPALAAQVVSWASSPFYSAPGKIKSVHDAVIRVLGFDMVLNLALGLALGKSMNTTSMNAAQISKYWYSAVCMAATVEGLVKSIPRNHRPGYGMAYLSGLLNNFGQLVLAEVFPPHFANLNKHNDVNTHIPQSTVEQQLIGVSSCQIAAWLFKAWNMPEEVVTAIRFQDTPDYEGEHNEYAKLNALAKQLLANIGKGFGAYKEIDSQLFASLHIDRETAEVTVENILQSADDLKAISDKVQG